MTSPNRAPFPGPRRRVLGILAPALLLPMTARAVEPSFLESFAVAKDRKEALKQLIPGTEDFFFFSALHAQNEGQLDEVDRLVGAWIQKHGRTDRVNQIELRQLLLRYPKDPQKSLESLRGRLGLHYDQERDSPERQASLPNRLDPALLSREALTRRALDNHPGTTEGFEARALEWAAALDLPPDRRRHLLSRLDQPDVPNLPQLVVDDLNTQDSQGFGSLGIHNKLLLAQLDECLLLKPDLLASAKFVNEYVSRLGPSEDVDVRSDAAARAAHLDRLGAFVGRLSPAFNSLKANVLYHRLVHDRALGELNFDRFLAYVRLPRNAPYVNVEHVRREAAKGAPADLAARFENVTRLPSVGNDEPLVRSYLERLFLEGKNLPTFAPYFESGYFRRVQAETGILHGVGNQEAWQAVLTPGEAQALKERVEIDFAPTNKVFLGANDPVVLEVDVKNVGSLLVKVFEVSSANFYKDTRREIDANLDLDGLVAGEERTIELKDPPLRRTRQKIELPALSRRGVFVVELIGNGKASRALLRKGLLRHDVRTTAAGHVFTVFDESGKLLSDARLWLGGRDYSADKEGAITVPFSSKPGSETAVILHGELAALAPFQHEAETYSLQAGIHVEREELLAGGAAHVVVRPALAVNGVAASLQVLEQARLRIRSTDRDGVESAQEISLGALDGALEVVREINVPERLAAIAFRLEGVVESLGSGQKVTVGDERVVALNGSDATDRVEAAHLGVSGGNYFLDLLGRTGEPRVGRAVGLSIRHRDFTDPVEVMLSTDARGRLELGSLPGVETVMVTTPLAAAWTLPRDDAHLPAAVHGAAGNVILLPSPTGAEGVSRAQASLIEWIGRKPTRDRFEALSVSGGYLRLAGLAPGNYELRLKETGETVSVRVAGGSVVDGNVVSNSRRLELSSAAPLAIASATLDSSGLTVKLAGEEAGSARVHVVATRYVGDLSPASSLDPYRRSSPSVDILSRLENVFVTGREIGDEYRYVLDRKLIKKHPGNLLERPSLLLVPWAVRATQTSVAEAGEGGGWGAPAAAQPAAPEAARGALRRAAKELPTPVETPSLDFLGEPALVLTNLKPDAAGVVKVPRERLGAHALVTVVAAVDGETVSRALGGPEQPQRYRDLRLTRGLDPAGHATVRREVSFLEAGQALTFGDRATTRFALYGSVGELHQLYSALLKDANLAEFRFVGEWGQLKPEEQREKYSKYACHELNFFLYNKDPKFFQEVVKPFLQNKHQKTFLDEWLLGLDLRRYLEPWMFERLNVVEKILLASRLEGEGPGMARHVRDLLELSPPSPEWRDHLFQTALRGRSLELGAEVRLAGLSREELKLHESLDAAVPMEGKPELNARGMLADKKDALARVQDLAESDSDEAAAESGAPAAGGRLKEKGVAQSLAKRSRLEVERRKAVRQLYRAPEKTQEWAETHYYQIPLERQDGSLVTVNAFWADFAAHDGKRPFFSPHLAEACRNFTEVLFALAVLDVPFSRTAPDLKVDGDKLSVTGKSPLVVYHEQLVGAEAPAVREQVFAAQNFFRHGDRQEIVDGETREKFVTGELLTHVAYGSQVVVTNPTSTPQKLEILLQIPRGSLPLLGSQATRTIQVVVAPFQTWATEYSFYFPAPGDFVQFPVHASKREKVVAFAQPRTFHVVVTPSSVDLTSWEHVSQEGTPEQVIEFLRARNLGGVNLERMAWRLRDKAFFVKALEVLLARHVSLSPTIWSFGLLHDIPAAVREYLRHDDGFVRSCGGPIESPLLTIDPFERRWHEHLEYLPLINARAHQLGKDRQILNDRFREQYLKLLGFLCYRPRLRPGDQLELTYYLLLQDRVDEALAAYPLAAVPDANEQLQQDYLGLYLGFSTGEISRSRALAEKHATHPVERWRKLFGEAVRQLDEIEGKPGAAPAGESGKARTDLAATEPSLELDLETAGGKVRSRNLGSCQVSYYLMDVELLFSRNPFVGEQSGQFAYIRPNRVDTLPVDAAQGVTAFAIPEEYRASNVLVEVSGGGQRRAKTRYSGALEVELIESFAQARVTNLATGKAFPGVYVKVYARMQDGSVKFYKDGYTDLRGRFDYGSLSTDELDHVSRFAILFLSGDRGAVVREASPPKR